MSNSDIDKIINKIECFEPSDFFRLIDALEEEMEYGRNEKNN